MRFLRVLLVMTALAAAVVPLPPRLVEAWYSHRIYPVIQRGVTPLSNAVPIALLDVAALALLLALVIGFWRRLRLGGLARTLVSSALTILTLTAALFLIFLGLWGLNYRRLPLDEKLDYDRNRVTREAATKLGDYAVREVNALHAAAHESAGVDRSGTPQPSLEMAFDSSAAHPRQRAPCRSRCAEAIAARAILPRCGD